jgi:hypothetical protein
VSTSDTIDNKPLILDLLEFVAAKPRTYAEVMDAWRTSCPRLPIWEDAVDHGLVARAADPTHGPIIIVTPIGRAFLHSERRVPAQ